jgi:hypothetical protein
VNQIIRGVKAPLKKATTMTLKRQLFYLVLLSLPFTLGEIYRFFDRDIISPWLDGSYHFKYTTQRYVDEISDRLIPIIYLSILSARAFKRIPLLQLACIVNLVYSVYDIWTFVYNRSKSEDYLLAYAALGLVTIVVYWLFFLVRKPKIRIYKKKKDSVEMIGAPRRELI